MTPTPAPQVESLTCPGCGASLTVRSMGRAVTIVCGHCHSILDARDPRLRILERFKESAGDDQILIPLGSRGKWRGTLYEVIGAQRREIHVEGLTYSWHEYLLFNPYKGFRYFTEYDGHWNDTSVVTALPEVHEQAYARYLGQKYRHFQTSFASTTFVIGEFPWQVTVGDRVEVTDYIAPPYVLSSETTGNETTWTLGEYVRGEEIWQAFQLPGIAPRPIGVYENQPSQLRASAGQIWFTFAALLAVLFTIFMVDQVSSPREQAYRASYRFAPSAAEACFVTPEFELKGRTSAVQVETDADVDNQWIYLNYALINEDSGQAFDFGREVSYYSGVDSDGRWTEGGRHDQVLVPSVPPGRYYLRIEPETDANARPIDYSVTVTRGVPPMGIYLAALAALLLPAVLISWRTYNFEQLRWAASDHPKVSVGGDE